MAALCRTALSPHVVSHAFLRWLTVQKSKERICIIMVTDLGVSGRTQREIEALLSGGYEVSVVYRRRGRRTRFSFSDRAKVHGLNVISRCLPKMAVFHFLMYIEFILRAVFLGVRYRADIYQGGNLSGLLPAFIAARLVGAKLVYDSMELWTEMCDMPLKRIWRRIETALLNRVDRAIAVNQERATVMVEQYGAPERPAVVMNCPYSRVVDECDAERLQAVLAEKGWLGRFVVLYQGALMAGRHLENLVAAMSFLPPEVVLIMMGHDNKFKHVLEREVACRSLEKRVLFHAPIPADEIIPFASGASVGIVFYENTGLNNYYCAPTKLYEYLFAGLPVVATDFPGLRNLVVAENVGRVVTSSNPKSIAEGIQSIAMDPAERDLMSRNGKMLAQSKYNWEQQAKLYLDIMEELTTRRSKRARH